MMSSVSGVMIGLLTIASVEVQGAEFDKVADSAFVNAVIYQHPEADALLVRHGRIEAIGRYQQVKDQIGQNTEVVDLQGAALYPGFIDNHNHIFEAASEIGGNCELDPDADLSGQIPLLRRCRQQSKPGQWVIGYGHSLDRIVSEDEQRTPLAVLDEVFPDRPVVIMEQTSHSMWVNSMALAKAGIDRFSADPPGGRLLRTAKTGELTGILFDNAGDILMELAWNSQSDAFQQSYQGLMNGLYEVAANGITTVGDGRMYWQRGWFDVWLAAQANGDLTARVSVRPWIYPQLPMSEQLPFLQSIRQRNLNSRLIVDQVKMYSDGILINGTARTLEPYLFTYIPDDPYGLYYIPGKEMEGWLTELNKLGYGAHIHAIGDGGVRAALDAIEGVRRRGSERDYTLTHVEMLNPTDLPRFRDLEVTADFQVGSDYIAEKDHEWAEPFIGHRAHQLMPVGKLYHSGANVSLSSDWNVHVLNPLVGIANALKMGADGLPDVDSAIATYTINAARSLGLAELTGSLDLGKSADLVILDQDLHRLSPEDMAFNEVLMTVLQGEIVYDIEDSE